MTITKSAFVATKLTSDFALGTLGCGLAAASAIFGGYMIAKAPTHKLDSSNDFSVFAQLAPTENVAARARRPSRSEEDLDMETTASIPQNAHAEEASDPPGGVNTIVRGVTLQAAGADDAEITIDGKPRKVRVGDAIPGAGELLAIYPGRRPMLRTSEGLIFSDAR